MERQTATPRPVEQPVAEHALQQAPVAAAPPATPAPAPVQPAAEAVLEPPRYNAAYLSNPPPAYPLAARRRGIEGTVLIRSKVSAAGECLRAELKKTSGSDLLDQAALEAVKKWRFVPARRGSQAVVAWVEVPITFKLENN
jgi:protein TonB